MRKTLLFAVWLLVFNLSAAPKYVFLFIGDGMGKSQVELARHYYGKLHMDRLPVRGSVMTSNLAGGVTDSAAAGTALACGIKTINGRLGMDAEGKTVDSVAKIAKKQGCKVAILTTVGVNNATPAAFYAHALKRSESRKILEQFPLSGVDILAGYGIDGFKADADLSSFVTGATYREKAIPDQVCSTPRLPQRGIQIINQNENEFFQKKNLQTPVLVAFPFGFEAERRGKNVRTLSRYLEKSIELLEKHPQGFFMMAEGGAIDRACHINDAAAMLLEIREFDLAIGKALDFYRKYPAETLIVVTADHDTGGLALMNCSIPENYTDVEGRIFSAYGIQASDTWDCILKRLADRRISLGTIEKQKLEYVFRKAGKDKVSILNETIRCLIDFRSGIYWTTGSHTNKEVDLYAIGCGSEVFAGRQENSEVGMKLKALYQ